MQADLAGYRTWFCPGEIFMACLLAGIIAIPAGIWFAGRMELSLAFIGAGVLFSPLVVFQPRLIRNAMNSDTDAVLDAFGKNEETRRVFWALVIAIAGLVLAQVVDPVMAQKTAEFLAGLVP